MLGQAFHWEKIAGWSFFFLTVYLSFYLTIAHRGSEALLISLMLTHFGIYFSFRKSLNKKVFVVLCLFHLITVYFFGRYTLEILSAIDGWKQVF
ncbi:hypothetical protein LEP1GSC050_3602 [Leptospira broomii serovar Hurstbridge str. 5399]|uniref:Uncharacterized protein n=1 Tax=Leptospira broomii serovar Hurstbridge str. 5399 TaxID=1049789 RepID=T0GI99_9LEPT|nr:hypothetical protein LEP1GSC050_3602 [Leptospira broomii serovar Hurstbridge str. 5399]